MISDHLQAVNTIFKNTKSKIYYLFITLLLGRMVKYFFDKLDDKLAGRLEPCETKLLLHIGYERTVVPFFAALAGEDGFENKWVGLNTTKKSIRAFEGGMFVIEVHESKDSDDYWLRVNIKLFFFNVLFFCIFI